MIVGYKLIDTKTGNVVQQWGGKWGECPGIPNPLSWPDGSQTCGVSPGEQCDGYLFASWEMDETEKPKKTLFDGAEFISRVTDKEYAAIIGSDNIQVKRWLDTFRLRGEIDVAGTTAQAAKVGLIALGLITKERAEEIFAEE